MYTLSKDSYPGWDKQFDTVESITITGDDLQTKYPDTYVRT